MRVESFSICSVTLSFVILIIIISTSACVSINFGSISVRVACNSLTAISVETSFSTPIFNLSRNVPTSIRFSVSTLLYVQYFFFGFVLFSRVLFRLHARCLLFSTLLLSHLLPLFFCTDLISPLFVHLISLYVNLISLYLHYPDHTRFTKLGL